MFFSCLNLIVCYRRDKLDPCFLRSMHEVHRTNSLYCPYVCKSHLQGHQISFWGNAQHDRRKNFILHEDYMAIKIFINIGPFCWKIVLSLFRGVWLKTGYWFDIGFIDTLRTHHSEIQVTTALSLISTLYKSLAHAKPSRPISHNWTLSLTNQLLHFTSLSSTQL
jgi:hypothetical protein